MNSPTDRNPIHFLDITISHHVWTLGADIDTDALAPGHAMKFGMDVIARHCLESVIPQFSTDVKAGDVIIAGPNFGIGSSREQAAAVLVLHGISAVIAPSYNGLFFRNAFNVGLLLLTCPNIVKQAHQTVRLNIDDAEKPLIMTEHEETLTCEPIPEFLLNRVKHGGLLNELRHQLSRNQHEQNHA
jgi:3-isopropylmalate/(R)-2-methylmalate dehydratase small subunit